MVNPVSRVPHGDSFRASPLLRALLANFARMTGSWLTAFTPEKDAVEAVGYHDACLVFNAPQLQLMQTLSALCC